MSRKEPRAVLRLARGAGVAALLALPAAAAAGEGPDLRPPAEPRPQAEWRARQQSEEAARRAFERELREDWRDWQFERGGALDDLLRRREEARRERMEDQREDWLGQHRVEPAPSGETLDRRLEAQWERQRELREGRGIGPPLPEAGRLLRPGRR
jgi:hypothetical protein